MKQDLRGRSGDDGPRAADGDGPSDRVKSSDVVR
jgi:hypothetical protein